MAIDWTPGKGFHWTPVTYVITKIKLTKTQPIPPKFKDLFARPGFYIQTNKR